MKKRHFRKFTALITAISLISSCTVINASALTSVKLDENVTLVMESGAENIDVCMLYKDIDAVEITFKAKELSYEYAETLDKNVYSDEEIERLRFDYYVQLNEKMYSEARNERTASILSELGISSENAVCEYGYPKIICTLSSEQIELAEKMELITRIVLKSDWQTSSDLGYTAADADVKVLSNTLENLVAKDTSFANHSFIYSDKYKFAMESVEDRDILVIYGVPEEDSYNRKFKEYIEGNLEEYSWLADVGIYPAGENRDIYSGYRFSVCSSSSEFTLERPLDVMFFVNNEVPYYAENVEEASEQTGFDISPYIYSDDVTSTEYTVPEGAEPTKYGDVTGDSDISISDVVGLNSFLINPELYPMTDTQIANSDCLKDNVINSGDSTLLLNYIAMIIDESELGE